ncbi:MAG: hypothetical protein KA886_01260 [Candidatus Cloacimonetes bacterium]|nr:hypothetical protein [Candidatus Cloacimonadota bacterium]
MKSRIILFFILLISTTMLSKQVSRQTELPSDLFLLFHNLSPESVSTTQFPSYLKEFGELKFNFNMKNELISINVTTTKRKSKQFVKMMNKHFQVPFDETHSYKKWINHGISFTLNNNTSNNEIIIEKAIFSNQEKLDLPANTYILDVIKRNVYENDKEQFIYLLGQPFEDNCLFLKHVWLYTDEGNHLEEMIYHLPEQYGNGYHFKLSSILSTSIEAETSEAKRHYILISSSTGGSGGIQNILIIDLKNKYPKILLKSDSMPYLDFSGKYLPNYQALLYLSDKDSLLIHQEKKKTILDDSGIYLKGKLIKEIELWGNFPVAFELKAVNKKNDHFALIIYQEVRGFANYDRIAQISNYLIRKDNEWVVLKRTVKMY